MESTQQEIKASSPRIPAQRTSQRTNQRTSQRWRKRADTRTHVLIVVQNLPVPLDRRVWLECQALVAAGFDVSVICPKGPGDPARQTLDGVEIHKYRPAPAAEGLLGYAWEFGYSWVRTAAISRRVWRARPFQVLQACNPPDTYWLLARWWRRKGVKFVYDQHDLNPELFLSRFGEPSSWKKKLELAVLLWLEQRTYRTAHHVVSTNESYRSIALERGGHQPANVTVVRSGPDTRRMRPVYPSPEQPPKAGYSLVYLGVMGPQDGVDTILEVMHELVHQRGRKDVHATLLGFGDCLESLKLQSTALGLDDVVTFTGRADQAMIARHLSGAHVGLCPDLKTPLNDVSTMNKTMEYMAYALPSVAFDLVETRVSGADSALYVPSGDVAAFANAVERLLDDSDLRVALSLKARMRVATILDWTPQAKVYVQLYESLTGHRSSGPDYVDLEDSEEFHRFVHQRSRRSAG